MGYYDGYLILSDIDGTLTMRGNELSDENCRALTHFMEEGGYFTIATGRAPVYLPHFSIRPNAPLVAVNGSMITSDSGETLLFHPLPKDTDTVIQHLKDTYPGLTRIVRTTQNAAHNWYREKDGEDCSVLFADSEPCLQYCLCLDSKETTLHLIADGEKRYGDRYVFDRSSTCGIDMYVKGSGKGEGLVFLKNYLPGIHTTIAVGNYDNDISMIRAADIGCAVGNATPTVKEAADRVIVSNTEHALAYIIDELIPSLKNA